MRMRLRIVSMAGSHNPTSRPNAAPHTFNTCSYKQASMMLPLRPSQSSPIPSPKPLPIAPLPILPPRQAPVFSLVTSTLESDQLLQLLR